MSSETASYSDRPPRITKEDLFMVFALWMQRVPVKSENDSGKDNEDSKLQKLPYSRHHKVGAVLVLPNDILHAVDCTRDGVHGVARLLMNHPDVAKGCKIFVSRKPCSFCTKLLVQSKVERVFFPPFEPEYHGVLKFTSKALENFIRDIIHPPSNNNEPAKDPSALERDTRKSVLEKFKSDGFLDNLTSFVVKNPILEKSSKLEELISDDAVKLALEEFEREKSQVDTLFTRSSIGQSVFVPKVEEAVLQYKKKICDSECDKMDDKIVRKTNELFGKFWKENWMKTVNNNLPWPAFDDKMEAQAKEDFKSTMKWMTQILVGSELDAEEISFQKVKSPKDNGKILNFKRATHLIQMARFLAERTDDPKRGVGAVIATDEENEIKALGWNGFPFKAIYGEFPRASDDDKTVEDKKYPFIIHGEQNALLMRNDKNLKGGTLFVTKTPCDECVPLIQMQGIKTVVLGEELKKKESKDLSYSKFQEKVEEGLFTCFEKKALSIPPSLSNWWQRKESKDLNYSKFKEKVKKKPPTRLPSHCYFHCHCGFCY